MQVKSALQCGTSFLGDHGMSEFLIHFAKDLLKMASDVGLFLKSSGSLFHKRTAIAGKEFEVVERRHFNGLIWPCELERVLMFDLRSTFIISIVCGRVSNWRAFLNSIIIA